MINAQCEFQCKCIAQSFGSKVISVIFRAEVYFTIKCELLYRGICGASFWAKLFFKVKFSATVCFRVKLSAKIFFSMIFNGFKVYRLFTFMNNWKAKPYIIPMLFSIKPFFVLPFSVIFLLQKCFSVWSSASFFYSR